MLDSLKEGVLRPDLYEPGLNAVYAALLTHYGLVADPGRVRNPGHKGTVESAIQHTQGTTLKGHRFESLEERIVWLAHGEECWAALASTGARSARCWRCIRRSSFTSALADRRLSPGQARRAHVSTQFRHVLFLPK